MESANLVQFLDEAICISLHTIALGKGMNSSGLLSAMGKIAG